MISFISSSSYSKQKYIITCSSTKNISLLQLKILIFINIGKKSLIMETNVHLQNIVGKPEPIPFPKLAEKNDFRLLMLNYLIQN